MICNHMIDYMDICTCYGVWKPPQMFKGILVHSVDIVVRRIKYDLIINIACSNILL